MVAAAAVAFAAPTAMATDPLAPHQLVVVEPTGDAVVALPGYDLDGDALVAVLGDMPQTGSISQLSKVFSDYGYEPKRGVAARSGERVTGSKNRVYYQRPTADAAGVGSWGIMSYTVSDASATSQPGLVTFVPPSGILVGSHFARGNDGWTVVGNKAVSSPATYEPSSRGLLNHYVYASDDKINTDLTKGDDRSLWYFQAPAKFLGHHGIAYGGELRFVLSSFHGDFSADKRNTGVDSADLHLVVFECSKCNVNKGVTVAFPLAKASTLFNGATTQFSVPLREGGGWVKDPKNTLVQWSAPSKCDFIEVLSGLSAVRILGDFTTWYESVALDSVEVRNTRGQVPICAQGTPDASTCTC